MRKRRVILILLGLVAAGAIVVLCRREREPEYGGKRLSEWVEGYLGASDDGKRKSREAFGQIGTNALPHLVKWLGYDMPAWKRRFYRSTNPAAPSLRALWRLVDNRDDSLQYGAMRALLELGPKAEGAIPSLSRLANGTKPSNSRGYAVVVLGEMGKAGFPALVGLLKNQHAEGAKWTPDSISIAHYVGQNAWMDKNLARQAVPALLNMLNDPDLSVRSAATNALQTIDPQALERATE